MKDLLQDEHQRLRTLADKHGKDELLATDLYKLYVLDAIETHYDEDDPLTLIHIFADLQQLCVANMHQYLGHPEEIHFKDDPYYKNLKK